MQIKILFDSTALDNRFLTGWGVSYLIDGWLLFDTGEKWDLLSNNMQNMDVGVSDIKGVVISHDHWDHKDGLWGLLRENSKIKVYACPNFGRRFKDRVKSYSVELIEINKFSQIGKNIYTTGEILGRYASRSIYEQSVVLRSRKGLVILTGCAHPGIIRIIERIKQDMRDKIHIVIGGFHLKGKHGKTIKTIVDKFNHLQVQKVAPSHCTGKKAIELFKEEFKDRFIDIKVGQTIYV